MTNPRLKSGEELAQKAQALAAEDRRSTWPHQRIEWTGCGHAHPCPAQGHHCGGKADLKNLATELKPRGETGCSIEIEHKSLKVRFQHQRIGSAKFAEPILFAPSVRP